MMEIARFKHFRLIFGLVSIFSGLTFAAPPHPEYQAELSSAEATDGSVVRVTVRFPKGAPADKTEISGEFEGTKFGFYRASEIGEGVFEALVGIPHNHKPGPSEIKISVGGVPRALSLGIVDAKYPSETLKVDNRHVNPRKRDLERIKRDIADVGKVYSSVTLEKLWKGQFVLPIDSPVTSVYGTKRLFNGQMQSYHNGLDLKAPTGTPIHAAGAGVVVLAKKLFFTGNTVLIDHGYGIVTLYAHMSKLQVKVGQRVAAGDLLGLSGMTGRANGPHLHWAVIINKVKVNPADFIKVAR